MKNEDVRLNAAIDKLRSTEPDPKEMENAAKRVFGRLEVYAMRVSAAKLEFATIEERQEVAASGKRPG
jgi:hypothetical protein